MDFKTIKSAAAALWLAVLFPLHVFASAPADFPSKPVRFIVPFPPGGTVDPLARLIGSRLSNALGQQFIIDNRGGAGGTLAVGLLTQSAPDGYTLLMSAGGEIVIAPNLRLKLPYDPTKDIIPISRVGSSQLVLVVHPSVPAKSVKELVAMAKAKPGSINFASAGSGSTAHLAGEQFKFLAGIDIVHIAYKGAGPALTDLIAGQVQMLISAYSSAFPHIKAGKLRPLAVATGTRSAQLPDVPTIHESGVPGFEAVNWFGMFAPGKTPRNIVNRVNAALVKTVKTPEMQSQFIALGADPVGSTVEEFTAFVRRDMEKYEKVVRISGAKVD